MLGMGVHYSMSVCPRSQEEVQRLARWHGYPDLAPAFVLSNTAVASSDLARHFRVKSYHYLELLVTSPRARGRGVATGIVRQIQSKE